MIVPNRLIDVTAINSAQRMVNNLRLNHFLYIHDCSDAVIVVQMNQKVAQIVVENCINCDIQIRDSVVITSQRIDVINSQRCRFLIDEVDVRHFDLFGTEDTTLQFTNECTLMENCVFGLDAGCGRIRLELCHMTPGSNPNSGHKMSAVVLSSVDVPKDGSGRSGQFVDGLNFSLTSESTERTIDQVRGDIEIARKGREIIDKIPNEQLSKFYEDDLKEYTEHPAQLREKIRAVADSIRNGKHVVVYTGAGISTSASIPDYRGPNGVWTLLKNGKTPASMELSQALPTYAHYALTELVRRGHVKYIVSTNLDGLHRRSGIHADEMSELHGNCYKEVCSKCKKEYLRGFDTLATRHDRWSHLTGRFCTFPCGGALKDTIVHFTENMPPDQMDPAIRHARQSDVAIVMGTSMNVQPAASLPEKVLRNPGGRLYIVNLQKTPFDGVATANLHEKTDAFMRALMQELDIPDFDLSYDHTLVLLKKEVEEADAKRKKWLIGAVAVAVAAVALTLVMRRVVHQ